jgi:deferrochelatase/peroxidase EfeB
VSSVDYKDVQGLVRFGYGTLKEARYLLLRVRDRDAARAWLAAAPVSNAEYLPNPPETALQIGFTAAGLRALGVSESVVSGFSPEFLEGMAGSTNRSRRLGDTGANDPANWSWGLTPKSPDTVLMLFAKQGLDAFQQSLQRGQWEQAFDTLQTLETSNMEGREPFGFVDGISQPTFQWEGPQSALSDITSYTNRLALGELLLGYPNEYGKYTERPLLDPSIPGADELPSAEDAPAKRDLGRNGSYFVMRQLEQDVRGFWQFLARNGATVEEHYRLGAAMVGRSLDGEPLIPASPERIDGVAEKPGEPRNAFTYDGDRRGLLCPLGAHIRRANPRNSDLFGHPAGAIAALGDQLAIPRPKPDDDLLASTRFHRILRRGREYGAVLSPEEALRPAAAGESPRGLHFACLAANISRQFEFVQNAWLMSTKFEGLKDEGDPLLGNRGAVGDCPYTGYFSIPRDGQLPRRLTGMPQFITVRGGSYFLLPSLRALRYISRAEGIQ